MHIAFLDLDPPESDRPAAEPSFGRGPQRVASPALLRRAALAREAGHAVSYHRLGAAALADAATRERLGADRLVVCGADAALLRGLPEGVDGVDGVEGVELFDPFRTGGAVPQGLPAYELARGQSVVHAEVDAAPAGEPLHPWALPSVSTAPPELAEARVAAAAAALRGEPAAQLWLNDERVRIDMARLRALAELVRSALRDHKTLVELHVRAWPEDLLAERIIDHLALLPVVSLDLLAGSLNAPALQRGGGLAPADVVRCAGEVLRGGLAHLSRLSFVLGMPGESADQCAAMVNEALRLAMSSRIPRLRFSFWLGDDGGAPPADAAEQERRFLAAHPGWHAVEYRGVQDLVSLSAMAYPQLKVVGPGL